VNADIEEIVTEIKTYLSNPVRYTQKIQAAFDWSRRYTLEKLEKEIALLLK
jgi:hypothetical protein